MTADGGTARYRRGTCPRRPSPSYATAAASNENERVNLYPQGAPDSAPKPGMNSHKNGPATMNDSIRPTINRPSGGSPRHMQQRALTTRHSILDASAAIFDARGYSAASIKDVITSKDLSKGALFYHFPSKEAIAQQLVHGWSSAVETAFSGACTAAEPPAQKLRRVFLDLSRGVESDLQLRAGMKLTLEAGIEGAHQGYRQWVDTTGDVVDEGIADGTIRDTAHAHHLAWNVCAGFVGIVNAAPIMREDVDLPTRIDDLITAHLSLVVAR